MTLLDTLIEIVNIPSVTGDEAALCLWLENRYRERYPTQRIGKSLVVGDYGPSEASQAHQVDESVLIEILDIVYDVLAQFLGALTR